jgi:hypothetical protein
MAKNEEKRKACANCNKSMKRVKWYYRNGGYYCNKTCFQKKQQPAVAAS